MKGRRRRHLPLNAFLIAVLDEARRLSERFLVAEYLQPLVFSEKAFFVRPIAAMPLPRATANWLNVPHERAEPRYHQSKSVWRATHRGIPLHSRDRRF